MIDLHAAMKALAERRPVFHSEADFQHALAWKLQEQYPKARIRLEYRAPHQPQRGYVDIWIADVEEQVGIELKYKTRALTLTAHDEEFDLLNQSAQDIGRYDTLKDIQRLERVVQAVPGSSGFVILLTNDSSYWGQARGESVDSAFRLHEGRWLEGLLSWSEEASSGTRRNREASLSLSGRYLVEWHPYSEVTTGRYGNFRYLLASVAAGPASAVPVAPAQNDFRLEVGAEDLLRALLILQKASVRGELAISYEPGRLRLARGKAYAEVPATGSWPATARGQIQLGKYLPRFRQVMSGTVVVSGTPHMVHFEHFSMLCKWAPFAPGKDVR